MRLKRLQLGAILVLCTMIFSLFMTVYAADDSISITLNGGTVDTDVAPVIIGGRTMVPARAISEAIGADVYWLASEQIAIIVKNDMKILMKIGEPEMYRACVPESGGTGAFFLALANDAGATVLLDAPPVIIGDRTMLPLRALCESLGLTVNWDDGTRTAILTCDQSLIDDRNTDKIFFPAFAALFDNQ